MDTILIIKDLQKSLELIDKNDYILKSAINHLQEQCNENEIKLVEGKIYELEPKIYNTREEFIKDYQPIFDLVDFPFDTIFKALDKRTFNWEEL